MTMAKTDILIGIDAGTSMIKAVAFDLSGVQIAVASRQNHYASGRDGAATQSLNQTWADCVQTLQDLAAKVEQLAERTVALGVTGQGDGTWLVGKNDEAVGDAWLWLDARAAPTVEHLRAKASEHERFKLTGTGMSACQQGPQIAHMAATKSGHLDKAEVALHCKDWLYLNLTGVRATDPSEASFTYGDFRTRRYDDAVIAALGLTEHSGLLPQIIDGTQQTHIVSHAAAASTGLLAGTPVSLGFVDMACTALGAGVYTGTQSAACSIIGSTGVHMRATLASDVQLNSEGTGYIIPLPLPDIVAQTQSNMAASLNIDWALHLAADLLTEMGQETSHDELVERIDNWMSTSQPGELIYHPYISAAGERGPFVNGNARASFIGLQSRHRFPDLMRAVVEGLGMATRDCYAAMGSMPEELRLSGGAGSSSAVRKVLSASVGARTRISTRKEAGAAGAAMIAAVAIGAYSSMDACIAEWVTPLLGDLEQPDHKLVQHYEQLFSVYQGTRRSLQPAWDQLAQMP